MDRMGGEDRTSFELVTGEGGECKRKDDESEEEEASDPVELEEEDETDRLAKVFRMEEVKVIVVDGRERVKCERM